MQNVYNALNGVVSSTEFDFGTYYYTLTTQDQFTNLAERAYITCVPGGGTFIQYNGTGTQWLFNNGSGSTGAGHVTAQGFTQCHALGPGGNNTTTLAVFGGTQGAEGAIATYNTIKGYGTPIENAGNTWEVQIQHNDISGYATGTVFDSANNSGENPNITDNDYHDGNTTSSPALVFRTASTIGAYVCGNSFDDATVAYGAGNPGIRSCNYFENPGHSNGQYLSYPFITLGNGTTMTSLDVFGNDATNTAEVPAEDVLNQGGTVIDAGMTTVANGTATTTASMIVDTNGGVTAGIGIGNVPSTGGLPAVSSTVGTSPFNALTFWIEPAYGTSTPDLALGMQGTANSSTFISLDGSPGRAMVGYDPATVGGDQGGDGNYGGAAKYVQLCVNGTSGVGTVRNVRHFRERRGHAWRGCRSCRHRQSEPELDTRRRRFVWAQSSNLQLDDLDHGKRWICLSRLEYRYHDTLYARRNLHPKP